MVGGVEVIETNCNAFVEFVEEYPDYAQTAQHSGESHVVQSYMHLKLVIADYDTSYLEVDRVKIPASLGGGHVECVGMPSALSLPLRMHLSEIKFSKMHELNGRRAELNVAHTTILAAEDEYSHAPFLQEDRVFQVYALFTLSQYQDILECARFDLIYFKILQFLNANLGFVYTNPFQYYNIVGDRVQRDLEALKVDEIRRHAQTVHEIQSILNEREHERSFQPVPSLPTTRAPISDEHRLRNLAIATLQALATAKHFVHHLRSLLDGSENDQRNEIAKLLLTHLSAASTVTQNCDSTHPHHHAPDPQLLNILTAARTPLDMMHALCDAIDAEQTGDGRLRADVPFAFRVCRRLEHADTKVTPDEHLHQEPRPKRVAGVRVKAGLGHTTQSIYKALEEAFKACAGSAVRPHVRVGRIATQPPDVLYIEVHRPGIVDLVNAMDEPSWLVLDSLLDLDGPRAKPARYTGMSPDHAAQFLADADRATTALPRVAQYRKSAVVREFAGHVGTEVFEGDRIVRVHPNHPKDAESIIYTQPSFPEMATSVLLVYVRADADGDLSSRKNPAKDDLLNPPGSPRQTATPRVHVSNFGGRSHNRPRAVRPPPRGGLKALHENAQAHTSAVNRRSGIRSRNVTKKGRRTKAQPVSVVEDTVAPVQSEDVVDDDNVSVQDES